MLIKVKVFPNSKKEEIIKKAKIILKFMLSKNLSKIKLIKE
jgi:hypothetical protein